MRFIVPSLALLLLVFASGCTQTSDITDCGSDDSCFANAYDLCKEARYASLDDQQEFQDLTLIRSMTAEVKPINGNSCFVEYKFNRFELVGDTSGYPQEALDIINSFNGASMRCTIPGKVELSIDSMNNIIDSCEGSLKTAFEDLTEYYDSLSDTLDDYLSKRFSVSNSICASGNIIVFIMNMGTEALSQEDFTITVDNELVTSGIEGDIQPMSSGRFSWNCGNTCDSGKHEIELKTVSDTLNPVVYCT